MNREEAISKLKAQEAELRNAGLSGLYLFGSIARGDHRSDSDIDLACDIDDAARIGLFGFAGIMLRLEESLASKVDLVPLRAMRPRIRAKAEKDMVQVF